MKQFKWIYDLAAWVTLTFLMFIMIAFTAVISIIVEVLMLINEYLIIIGQKILEHRNYFNQEIDKSRDNS